MRTNLTAITILLFLAGSVSSIARKPGPYDAIYSGVPWQDDKGNPVSAHGGCIIKDNGEYYLFGEKHTDTSNAFAGFTCYSSGDLCNWKFESIALPVQLSGKLGPGRVGERVKVMKCPKTGEYIMYMHVDTLSYTDQFVGYATANSVTGPYTFQGPLLFNGFPIRKWDMGTFQDNDGAGYVLLHGGDIYRLGDDYKSISEQVSKSFDRQFEAPAIFRKDSVYFYLGSHLTSWEKNDNYYYTATSLRGPWTHRGMFAPEGTLTWYSQTTYVFPISGSGETTYMYMGDRWSYPKQAAAATYVWQPLLVSGTSISIPAFSEAWQVSTSAGAALPVAIKGLTIPAADKKSVIYSGIWRKDSLSEMRSDQKGASFSAAFSGRQICLYGIARPDGGYAKVTLQNSKGEIVLSEIIDMYCKYTASMLKFVSPMLIKGNYTLIVWVMGERGNWSDKRKSVYGSTGYAVAVDKLVLKEE